MKSFVVVEKKIGRSDVDAWTFRGFDVCEGEVAGALFTCSDSEMDRVVKLTRAYEDELFSDVARTYQSTKSLAFIEERIDLLLSELFDEIPLFALFRTGERREMWLKPEMHEMVDVLSGDGVYVYLARDAEGHREARVSFASGDGDYCVIMSGVGFGDSSVDFNPRGFGFISVVESELLDEIGERYAVVYTGEKWVCDKIKRLMFCVGKRAGLKQEAYVDREHILAKRIVYYKELSEVTDVDVSKITDMLT